MRIAFLLPIVLWGCLIGCGQKGPLVLPDAQHPHKKVGGHRPQSSPAPATPAPAAPAPSSAPSSAPATPPPAAPESPVP